jgi:NAD(P)-dependent dehydrogenase (short-subunit alcohol dehydrogenase family)
MASATTTLLSNKTAIVTGGTRGIGRGVSLELAKRGANVAMIYMNPSTSSAARALAQELESLGTGIRAVAVQADLSDPGAPAKVVEQTLLLLKVSKIDIVGMLIKG